MERNGTASRKRFVSIRRGVVLALCIITSAAVLVVHPAPFARFSNESLNSGLRPLNKTHLTAYLASHPEVLFEVLNERTTTIARTWPTMKASDRSALVTKAPVLIGNLDGVPYGVRDKANRLQLAHEIKETRARLRASPNNTADLDEAKAYAAINSALHASSAPPRQLVEFVPGRQPTAAISVGDLSTATTITWAVPGMGTYSTDMQLWTEAAQNIWSMQAAVGGEPHRAVIAWIGYATPPVGLDAAIGDYAANGAPRLIQAIQGVRAVRRSSPLTLNVVAHSYGTTMAADALAESHLGVSAFVMLGSAGIEESIPDALTLHTASVFAGEATADQEADLGRISRTDPLEPAFGAIHLDVDGNAAAGLAPVTGHEPILHSPWNDNIASSVWSRIANPAERNAAYQTHLQQHGYLDTGTQSLLEVAIATTPSSKVPLNGATSPALLSTTVAVGH